MALTTTRWILVGLIGLLLVAVGSLQEPVPRFGNRVPRTVLTARATHAGEQLGIAAERYRILQLRDSVRSAMGPASSSQSRLAMARDLNPQVQRVLQRLMEHVDARRPQQPRVSVDVAFVLDTAQGIGGASRAGFDGILVGDYVLPRPNSNERCLVLARTKDLGEWGMKHPYAYANARARLLSDATRLKLLGPCAFYEQFGSPGPQIDRWLQDQRWSLGLLSSWETPFPAWESQRGWYENLFSGTLFMNWGLRRTISPRGFACAAGDVAACERAILARPEASSLLRPRTTLWSGVVSTGEGFDVDRDSWWNARARELGPRDWTILAEMVRTLGPERFAQFWRSTLPPRDAFQAAAGQDIGSWTRDWALRLYGHQARGPGLSGTEALVAGALGILALAFALAASARRQVA